MLGQVALDCEDEGHEVGWQFDIHLMRIKRIVGIIKL